MHRYKDKRSMNFENATFSASVPLNPVIIQNVPVVANPINRVNLINPIIPIDQRIPFYNSTRNKKIITNDPNYYANDYSTIFDNMRKDIDKTEKKIEEDGKNVDNNNFLIVHTNDDIRHYSVNDNISHYLDNDNISHYSDNDNISHYSDDDNISHRSDNDNISHLSENDNTNHHLDNDNILINEANNEIFNNCLDGADLDNDNNYENKSSKINKRVKIKRTGNNLIKIIDEKICNTSPIKFDCFAQTENTLKNNSTGILVDDSPKHIDTHIYDCIDNITKKIATNINEYIIDNETIDVNNCVSMPIINIINENQDKNPKIINDQLNKLDKFIKKFNDKHVDNKDFDEKDFDEKDFDEKDFDENGFDENGFDNVTIDAYDLYRQRAGKKYNHEKNKIIVENDAKVFYFDTNTKIKKENIPDVDKLIFCDEYNHKINANIISPQTKEIIFGSAFDKTIVKNGLSENLEILEFGCDFNQNLIVSTSPGVNIEKYVCVLPSKLKSLKLGHHYNREIREDSLPSSLEKLIFGKTFNKNIKYYPSNLKHLEFGSGYQHVFKQGQLPNTLTHLILDEYYNQEFKKGVLPVSLEHLKIGHTFNREFKTEILPNKLITLELGNSYNQEFKLGILPQSLKVLCVGDDYNQKITKNILPLNLTEF